MKGSTRWYDAEQLRRISEVTIAHYDRLAKAYWDGTRDHDVTQNYAARSWMRLRAIPPPPFLIWVVGPAETYATSDHWATTSWVWTDRPNSWPRKRWVFALLFPVTRPMAERDAPRGTEGSRLFAGGDRIRTIGPARAPGAVVLVQAAFSASAGEPT